jgi:hypothetical protein
LLFLCDFHRNFGKISLSIVPSEKVRRKGQDNGLFPQKYATERRKIPLELRKKSSRKERQEKYSEQNLH